MRRFSTAVLIAAVMLGSTACASTQDDSAKSNEASVATLRSAEPSVAASEASAERERYRLDDTLEDQKARMKPWEKCMAEHGVDINEPGWKKDGPVKDCDNLLPLPAWELDPTNPEAKDFSRDVVKCLKDKGVQYAEVAPEGVGWELGGKDNDPESISKGMTLGPVCQREVAAKK
ncbi:hypothetical protein ACIBF5_09160 [Micromonospora sp. NPDC050417]|uniref:hypothetical protein n=1 Tax=Micromonospora sp. NPDC050417 TaxID=3364280 RepID=UPI0037BD9214